MTLDTPARAARVEFLPEQSEQFDFIVPKSRADRPGAIASNNESPWMKP
jgi:hypothetical protein